MIDDLAAALQQAYPELERISAVAEEPVYLVGGAVRDLLLGKGRSDIDVVVVGDAASVAARLGGEVIEHERFATAKARLDGHEVDFASARSETYPEPGALPVVEPAEGIEADLARRDFTVNAIAIPLSGEPCLIDPHGGQIDLESGLLRVLHQRSFEDDPTRALRAARYAARFGFELEPRTDEILRAADLEAVSADRCRAELLRLSTEASAPRGFGLLEEWGLLELREGGAELAARVAELLSAEPWRSEAPLERAVLAAAVGPVAGEGELARERPQRPSEGVELAHGRDGVELVLARALGATWLDRYLSDWRPTELQIGGEDLIAAGVPQGPAVGRGLRRALSAKVDGEVAGREHELEIALAAAREPDALA